MRVTRYWAAALSVLGMAAAAHASLLGDEPYQCSTRGVVPVNACSGLFKIDCVAGCPNLSRCTSGCSLVNALQAVVSGGTPWLVVSVQSCAEYSSTFDIYECDTAGACTECEYGSLLMQNVSCIEPLNTTYVKDC